MSASRTQRGEWREEDFVSRLFFQGLLSFDPDERASCIDRISLVFSACLDRISSSTSSSSSSSSSLSLISSTSSSSSTPTLSSSTTSSPSSGASGEEEEEEAQGQRAKGSEEEDMDRRFLLVHLPTLLRLSLECPFPDVSSSLSSLVDLSTKGLGIDLPRPTKEFSKYLRAEGGAEKGKRGRGQEEEEYTEEEVERMVQATFIHSGRVGNLVRLLSWHPSYLERFLTLLDVVMEEPGALLPHWRHYLAILAASRFSCQYLVNLQEKAFLERGEEMGEWLEGRGLENIPGKMQAILNLNSMMAHQPWRLSAHHIALLVDPALTPHGVAHCWSLSELVHALVILSSFHSLSGLVLGCGLVPEIDIQLDLALKVLDQPLPSSSSSSFRDSETESDEEGVILGGGGGGSSGGQTLTSTLAPLGISASLASVASSAEKERERSVARMIEIFNRVSFQGGDEDSGSGSGSGNGCGEEDEGERRRRAAEYWEATDDDPSEANPLYPVALSRSHRRSHRRSLNYSRRSLSLSPLPTLLPCADKYVHDDGPSRLHHIDFDVHSPDYSICRISDYNWTDHGYELVTQYYPLAAPLLDDLFSHTLKLTYNTFSDNQDINTQRFREAIWYYVHRLKGIFHEYYNYQDVNVVLSKRIKSLVKKVVCYPDTIGRSDFEYLDLPLTDSEKVHLILIATEASKQAELLYALRAIMRYQSER